MHRTTLRFAAMHLLLEDLMIQTFLAIVMVLDAINKEISTKRTLSDDIVRYTMIDKIPDQVKHLNRLVRVHDSECIDNLRMDRNNFASLCFLMREVGGLVDAKYVGVEEQVAMFLSILCHHKKNRVVKFDFIRSGQTVSHYLHIVLKALLKLHSLLLVKPTPVAEDCTNTRWKSFKGCLGALDGTYINVQVPLADKPRYRTRKGQISTNVLAICDRDMQFVYVLPGWEGSAADARVLRNAVNRPHGLRVGKGTYYLCDNGYANSEGFLTPYKGVRYHLDEWGPSSARPANARELFNMRHTRARNVIERAFGLMTMRWGILRSATYYPIKVQNRLIMACFLLHNFIRREMPNDPLENLLDTFGAAEDVNGDIDDVIETVESSPEWNNWRDELANSMWNEWSAEQ